MREAPDLKAALAGLHTGGKTALDSRMPATVKREWRTARLWLARELRGGQR
jgi:hypothetical protein